MPETTLPRELQELYDSAEQAAGNAYVPYSGFRVGAALRTEAGEVFTGCNVENASYGLTICAERVACTKAVSTGERSVVAIAIYVEGPDGQPCGACRQVLAEFGPEMAVVYRRGGAVVSGTMRELLPHSFVPGTLHATRPRA